MIFQSIEILKLSLIVHYISQIVFDIKMFFNIVILIFQYIYLMLFVLICIYLLSYQSL